MLILMVFLLISSCCFQGLCLVSLTIIALQSHVGQWAGAFIAGSILLFCFTSIIANYSYAESNILF